MGTGSKSLPTWQVAVGVQAVGAQRRLWIGQGDGAHRGVVQALLVVWAKGRRAAARCSAVDD